MVALPPIELPTEAVRDHVVVAGYGRGGRAVARALRAAGIPLMVVELDHALFSSAVAEGIPAVWGDITRDEVLHAAQIESARILILTVPDRSSVHMGVEHARRLNPKVFVIARASREHHIAELRALGVDAAVQAEFEGGVEMVRQALIGCGRNDAEARHLIAKLREER